METKMVATWGVLVSMLMGFDWTKLIQLCYIIILICNYKSLNDLIVDCDIATTF